MKEGVKTSELWIVLGTLLTVLFGPQLGLELSPDQLYAASIGAAGYAGARGVAKLRR